MSDDSKHSTRVAIISGLVSLVLSIVFAAYIVGQRTGKVLVLEKWQNETAPRIERMDRQGTVSFEYFLTHYKEEQGKQYARLKALEDEVRHLETMQLRIERLEKRVGIDP